VDKAIAIITARGGSKRIPHKNIKDFLGQPIIKYAIDAALQSKIFDTIMVSTDDEEIAGVAKQCGADVPFMRSKETSNDLATTSDVLLEVVYQYKKENQEFDNLCCIYPSVPFLKGSTLVEAYNIFTKNNIDALMPVVQYSYPIQRSFRLNDDGLLEYMYPEYIKSRSQDLEPAYHDVGMFYIVKTGVLLKEKSLVPPKIMAFVMSELEIQDIDTQDDWAMAELKYKLIMGR
jgi:N-acylneuraminate cytidylyltransferase